MQTAPVERTVPIAFTVWNRKTLHGWQLLTHSVSHQKHREATEELWRRKSTKIFNLIIIILITVLCYVFFIFVSL